MAVSNPPPGPAGKRRQQTLSRDGLSSKGYRAIQSSDELNEAVSGIRKAGQVSFDLETTSLDPLEATIVGFALCWEDEGAAYIPVNHTQDGKRLEPGSPWNRS